MVSPPRFVTLPCLRQYDLKVDPVCRSTVRGLAQWGLHSEGLTSTYVYGSARSTDIVLARD